MTTEFRETRPEDSQAVAAFLRSVFATEPSLPFIAPPNLHWKNWEPRPDWTGSRGYAIAKDGVTVAHGTVVPLSCLAGQQRLKMVHLIDWAADPKSVGSGVVLLKRVAEMADAILACGGSAMTQKVMPALGFKTCATVTSYVRPVRPLKRLAGDEASIRAVARFGRSLLWSLQAPSLRSGRWTASRVRREQLHSTPIPWPRAREGTAILERSADVMDYFLRCPVAPMTLYAVNRDGSSLGYFLLVHVPGQARIVDFYAESDSQEDWKAVLQLAVARAMEDPAIAEVVSLGSDPVTHSALLSAGFHPRGQEPLRILLRKGVEAPAGSFRFQLIDNDVAYLHDNKASYWA